jgi:hypothetical protein
MTTIIPQELAEEILDHLADDFPSLGACSLVSMQGMGLPQ